MCVHNSYRLRLSFLPPKNQKTYIKIRPALLPDMARTGRPGFDRAGKVEGFGEGRGSPGWAGGISHFLSCSCLDHAFLHSESILARMSTFACSLSQPLK